MKKLTSTLNIIWMLAIVLSTLTLQGMETNHNHHNESLMLLSPMQRTNIARLCSSETMSDTIQKNIAQNMIADFLLRPKAINTHIDNPISTVAISSNNAHMITGSHSTNIESPGTAQICDINGELLHTLDGHTFSVSSVAISSDSTAVVTGSWGDTVKIWGIDGRLHNEFKTHRKGVHKIAINSDNTNIVTIGIIDPLVKIWDFKGNLLHNFSVNAPHGHTNIIQTVAIHGTTVVTGSSDNTAKIWTIDGNLLCTLLGHINWVTSLAICDNTIVTGSKDGTAKIWRIENGQLMHTLSGHGDAIMSVAISSDNTKVITGSLDGTTKIWNMNGQLLHTLIGGIHDRINSVAISSDNAHIVTNTHIWPLQLDFNAEEFNTPEHPLTWIKHTILPNQANLIARAHARFISYQAGKRNIRVVDRQRYKEDTRPFMITSGTEDALIWATFPDHVRNYLMETLNIELTNKQECVVCCHLKTNLLACPHCTQSFCKECAENWIGANFTYTTNYQNHIIHQWNVRNDSCPYCRQKITQEQLQDMINSAGNSVNNRKRLSRMAEVD